jgi:hypothetical protein
VTLLNEAAETDVGLEEYLAADVELSSICNGVFSTFIGLSSTPLPVVRFFQVEQDDLMNVSGNRVWTTLVYQVEAVTNGPDTSEAREISQRLDELLHLLRGAQWGSVLVEEVIRQAPLFRKTVESGDPYVYAGGEYLFHVSA